MDKKNPQKDVDSPFAATTPGTLDTGNSSGSTSIATPLKVTGVGVSGHAQAFLHLCVALHSQDSEQASSRGATMCNAQAGTYVGSKWTALTSSKPLSLSSLPVLGSHVVAAFDALCPGPGLRVQHPDNMGMQVNRQICDGGGCSPEVRETLYLRFKGAELHLQRRFCCMAYAHTLTRCLSRKARGSGTLCASVAT
eukprot:scaffold12064_cov23-Tisochrysis_lutea.AAC.1